MTASARQDGRANLGSERRHNGERSAACVAPRVRTVMALVVSALIARESPGAVPNDIERDEPPAPVRRLGTPLDNARFDVDGKVVLRGTFASDVKIDSMSLGQVTYSREEGRLHEIVAVRVSRIDENGVAWPVSDEELESGTGPCRIIAGRDVSPWPASALDTLSGLSVSTLLTADGTADVRVDVLFPGALLDDNPDEEDREPEAILVGPPPSGPITLGGIIAGDLEDPVVAAPMVEVPPEALAAGRSNVSVIYGRDGAHALPVAMVGYDLNELSAPEGSIIGLRIEIPRGVMFSCKLIGGGKTETQMLASAELANPLIGALGDGYYTGDPVGGAYFGPLQLPPPVSTPFANTSLPGGGGGDGGPSDPPETPSPVPTPATIVAFAAIVAANGRRRRRG